MSDSDCPSHDELWAFMVGRAGEDGGKAVSVHVDACPDCQATLADIDDAEDTLVAQLRQPAADPYWGESQCRQLVAELVAVAGESASPADTPLEPSRLGEYDLLEELGHGAMGTVYKALHTKLRRTVALKVLPQGRKANRQAVARFEREMKAVGVLDHPNIVRAYDAREVDGTRLLVMEYIEGLDLSMLVRRLGRLPIPEACELVRQTALGLQAAHEHGLVHRDVKPSNLMLTADGQVKVLDLGLARIAEAGLAGEEISDSGQAMGTADYMAPEQASDSHTVDTRADIYSLGCTLYKLLSGRAPFGDARHRTAFEKMTAHVNDPIPPIRQLRGEVPEELAGVMDRMLAKEPTGRYTTPGAVAKALEPFAADPDLLELAQAIETHPVPQSPAVPTRHGADQDLTMGLAQSSRCGKHSQPEPRERRRWRRPASLVALGTVAVLAFAAVIIVATDRGTLDIKTYDEDVKVSILSNGRTVKIVDTKNGNEVTLRTGEYELKLPGDRADLRASTSSFTLKRGGKVIVEVWRVASTVPAKSEGLPATGLVAAGPRATLQHREHLGPPSSVAFSPDGKTLAAGCFEWFGEYGGITLWDPATGKLREVWGKKRAAVLSVAYSPDGKILASSNREGWQVRLWDTQTGELLHTLHGHSARVHSVAFSPDGKTLASGGGERGENPSLNDDTTIRFWDPETGELKRVFAEHERAVESVAFSPDGKTLVSASWDTTIKLWDVKTGSLRATFAGDPPGGDSVLYAAAISPDGKMVASAGEDAIIRLWRMETGELVAGLKGHTRTIPCVTFSPDGRWLASASWDRTAKLWDVQTQKLLATFPGHNERVRSVAFSPDGRTLASASYDRTIKLWDLPVEKQEVPRRR